MTAETTTVQAAPARMMAIASSCPGSQSSHTGILAVSALPIARSGLPSAPPGVW